MFCKIVQFLKAQNCLTDREISAQFIQGFDLTFRNKVRTQLRTENPTHHMDDPYALKQICSATLFILSCNHGDNIHVTETAEPMIKRKLFDASIWSSTAMQGSDSMMSTMETKLGQAIAKYMSKQQSTGNNTGARMYQKIDS